MATWKNIFDLGEWELYVQFNGVTETPVPDSRNHLVKASEMDPDVGSVSVDAQTGEIIIETENPSGSGGTLVTVVVMPKGWTPPEAPCRVSGGEYLDDVPEYFMGEGPEGNGPRLAVVAEMVPDGFGAYDPDVGDVEALPVEQQLHNYEMQDPVPSGLGIAAWQLYGGF